MLIAAKLTFGQNTGNIEGMLTDSSGKALKGVEIHVLNSAGARTNQSACSRTDGSYTITGMWAGIYDVQYSRPGKCITIVHGVTVMSDAGTEVNLTLHSCPGREYVVQEYNPPALKKMPKYFKQ